MAFQRRLWQDYARVCIWDMSQQDLTNRALLVRSPSWPLAHTIKQHGPGPCILAWTQHMWAPCVAFALAGSKQMASHEPHVTTTQSASVTECRSAAGQPLGADQDGIVLLRRLLPEEEEAQAASGHRTGRRRGQLQRRRLQRPASHLQQGAQRLQTLLPCCHQVLASRGTGYVTHRHC